MSIRRNRLKSTLTRFYRSYLTPGVYREEVSSGVRAISGVDTSITAFVGWTPEGSTTDAQRVFSFQDFQAQFGALDARSLLGYAIQHFFSNGGNEAWIVRLAVPEGTPLQPNEMDFESALDPVSRDGGIYLLDQIDLFNVLCVPGETNANVISALQAFCTERRAFLIVDGPEGVSPADMQSVPEPAIAGLTAVNSALYYPWVNAADPLDGYRLRAFPPSGFVAGIYARTDVNRGVWKAPAGMQAAIAGAAGTEVTLDDGDIRQLNPRGINCIRTLTTAGTLLWGSRTLASVSTASSAWKYVPVRRLALFLEESLDRGTQWAVFEENDETLWSRIRLNVEAFMYSLYQQGAFSGSQSKDAFFVRCDASTTTAYDIQAGVVNFMVGFAPVRPAEFVVIRIAIKQQQ